MGAVIARAGGRVRGAAVPAPLGVWCWLCPRALKGDAPGAPWMWGWVSAAVGTSRQHCSNEGSRSQDTGMHGRTRGQPWGCAAPPLQHCRLPCTNAARCSSSSSELPASCSCFCSAPWPLPGRVCPSAAGRRPAPAASMTSCMAWATMPPASLRWARGRASHRPSRAGSTACCTALATTLRASSPWASVGSTLALPATTHQAALWVRTSSRRQRCGALTPALPAPGSAKDTRGRTSPRLRPRELRRAFTERGGNSRSREGIPGGTDPGDTMPGVK